MTDDNSTLSKELTEASLAVADEGRGNIEPPTIDHATAVRLGLVFDDGKGE